MINNDEKAFTIECVERNIARALKERDIAETRWQFALRLPSSAADIEAKRLEAYAAQAKLDRLRLDWRRLNGLG